MSAEPLSRTSVFTADGWADAFYSEGMKAAYYWTYYAAQFQTAEVD